MVRRLQREAQQVEDCSTVFIYALKCPTTGFVRYVGKTADPLQRLTGHLKSGIKKDRRQLWVDSLLANNLKPVLEILDEVPSSEWQQWEVAYIQYFRDEGFELLNQTLGGKSGLVFFR